MLISIVGGQGMAKLFSKAISGLEEVNSISLKCDLCDYETKSCRKSRAKKHKTSHCEKHHSEDKDVSKNIYLTEIHHDPGGRVDHCGQDLSGATQFDLMGGVVAQVGLPVKDDTGEERQAPRWCWW